MYLRTSSRKNRDGSVVEYYQLAHNERHPVTRKPVARVIHSFGQANQLDRGELVRLYRSIARVCTLEVIDLLDSEVPLGEAGGFAGSFELHRTYPYGINPGHRGPLGRAGHRDCLRSFCNRIKHHVSYERAIFTMVANLLCQPENKLGVWDRWLPTAYLPSCWDLKLAQMYEALDMLFEHAEEIEKKVFFQTVNLFNLKVDLIFYDTTTPPFSVDREDEVEERIRKFSPAAEGFLAPQIVVALAVTQEGFPVKSWVLLGNTADVSTVEKVRADLSGWQLGRAIFVADASMNSSANREELARACWKYLLATRMTSISEIEHEGKVVFGDPQKLQNIIQ